VEFFSLTLLAECLQQPVHEEFRANIFS